MANITSKIQQTFKYPNIAASYGPYQSKHAAHLALADDGLNIIGMTVGIEDSTTHTIKEWWYQGGTTEADLVEKQAAEIQVDQTIQSGSPRPVAGGAVASALEGKAPSTNIQKTALANDVQTSLGKADTAVQSITRGGSPILKEDGVVDIPDEIENVVATPVAAGGSPTVNLTNGTLTLGIPSGADGQNGANAYNPFKGTYLITDTIPTTGQAGDYIYVIDSQTPSVTHMYTWNGTAFVDSGETVTMGDSQFANSTKPISQTNIINNLNTGGADDVLSAEQGNELKLRGSLINIIGDGNNTVRDEIYCKKGHSYRITPSKTSVDFSGVTYTSSAYDLFAMIVIDNPNIVLYRIGCDKKSEELEPYYDVYCPKDSLLRIVMRCTAGENVTFNVIDTTNIASIPKKTSTGYIKNDGTVNFTGVNNHVSWYRIPAMSKVSVTSMCSDIILGQCNSIGQDTGIIPLVQGIGNNSFSFTMYFKEETIIALTWIKNNEDFYIHIESSDDYFKPVYGEKTLLDIFQEGDVSGFGFLNKNILFEESFNEYFDYSLENGLTSTRTIKILNNSNRSKTIDTIQNHKYAAIQTLRCDSFTPYATSVATGYFNRGGGVIGITNDVDVEGIEKYNYMSMIDDKKYHTLICTFTALTNSTQLFFGTRNPVSGGNISGTFYIDNIFVIDLTEVFGDNIPDYEVFVDLFGKYLNLFTKQTFVNDAYTDKQKKESFVAAMNRTASQLGMINSHFSNPGGSDEIGNYFTANDALKMLCYFAKHEHALLLSSIPSYTISVDGVNKREVVASATYKGETQVSILSPYTIIAGKTGTLNADSHIVSGINTNTANVGLVVKSPVDGKLLAGVVILPLVKTDGVWKTKYGDTSPYNSRYSSLKSLFDLLELARTGVDVSEDVEALQCDYAAACVVPEYIEYSSNPATITKDGSVRCYPASMTKMITFLTLIADFDYNENLLLYGSDVMGGSGIEVGGGDIIKGSEAIIGMMLPSSNTLASAFSRIYGQKYLKK